MNNLRELLDEGKHYYEVGDYETAKEIFSQINIRIQNHECYYWFAKIREALGLKKDAIMYYNFALERYNEESYLISKQKIIEAKNNCEQNG